MLTEEVLFAYLSATVGISSLVGNRIYPLRLPDEVAMPAMVYSKVDCTRAVAHSGSAKLAEARFQLDCYSDDYLQAKRLARAVSDNLHGHKDLNIQAAFADNENDGFESAGSIFRVRVDIILWHKEN